jgi:hypothetical protein
MSGTTVSDLNGLFKDQFHKDIEDLRPQHVILQKDGFISWVPSDKMNGEFYSIPTLLRSNQGVTYLGETGAIGTLKDARSGVMKEAQVKGSEINVRGQISYKALSQAASAGPRAFKKSSAWLVEDLANVAHIRLEMSALYGQSGIGEVETSTQVSGATYDIVITEESFAAGSWVSLEGAAVEFFDGTDIVGTSLLGVVSTVTTSSRTVRMVTSGTGIGSVVAGNTIFPESAAVDGGTYNEMAGLYKQMTATSGTLFNIDRAAYALMQGNSVDLGDVPLTKALIVEHAMKAVDKGCMSDMTLLVGTKTFAALNAEDMALRMFDGSYKPEKSQSGNRELIYENVNGSIKVVCHPMVKNGHAFLFNPEDVLWVGSAKPTFEIPGKGGEFFRLLDGSNAIELQNYADIALYVMRPAQTVMFTGIVN